mmetsp:Transcript_2670/g.8034  ORF Transcript_2670/g.8034 Transcript_2670/m.8034 type:complete len:356 (+) Transcript_2670:76-1143(+)
MMTWNKRRAQQQPSSRRRSKERPTKKERRQHTHTQTKSRDNTRRSRRQGGSMHDVQKNQERPWLVVLFSVGEAATHVFFEFEPVLEGHAGFVVVGFVSVGAAVFAAVDDDVGEGDGAEEEFGEDQGGAHLATEELGRHGLDRELVGPERRVVVFFLRVVDSWRRRRSSFFGRLFDDDDDPCVLFPVRCFLWWWSSALEPAVPGERPLRLRRKAELVDDRVVDRSRLVVRRVGGFVLSFGRKTKVRVVSGRRGRPGPEEVGGVVVLEPGPEAAGEGAVAAGGFGDDDRNFGEDGEQGAFEAVGGRARVPAVGVHGGRDVPERVQRRVGEPLRQVVAAVDAADEQYVLGARRAHRIH